jgi:hypothetical protein
LTPVAFDMTLDFTATTRLERCRVSNSRSPDTNEHVRFTSEFRLGETQVTVDDRTLRADESWLEIDANHYRFK